MSPSARGRKRPRVKSFTFQRLAYVLTREAALRVLFDYQGSVEPGSPCRLYLARARHDHVARNVAGILQVRPDRAQWPR